jgi:hypothetical protein
MVEWSDIPVAAEVGEEVVLMHLPNGRCYGLGLVGTDIWKKLRTPMKVGLLIESLCNEYAGEDEAIELDVLETLEQYVSEGLIVIRNE